jgi:hypothetical protein
MSHESMGLGQWSIVHGPWSMVLVITLSINNDSDCHDYDYFGSVVARRWLAGCAGWLAGSYFVEKT